MDQRLALYGEISRVDEEARMVWGYAATTTLAADGQEITIEALEGALDEYMQFANIREMHQQVAVGVARDAHVDDTGMYLGAHVVDDAAWAKVKAGVYKGFSIKGPVTSRDALKRNRVTGLKIYEISLVDRPSDPNSVFDVWRSVDAGDTPTTTDAAPAALEDDMSRVARKPEAEADQPAEAPATEAVVERAADAPAEESEAAQDQPEGEGEVERAAEGAEGEEGQAPTPETEAPVDDVTRTVQAAEAAAQRAAEAIDAVERGAEPAAAVVELPGAELRRSLSLVNRLGYVLNELTYVIFDADFEKEIEGDESAVPAQLRDALRTLAAAYKAMSVEEVDELLASLKVDSAVTRSVFELTRAGDTLERGTEGGAFPEDLGAQVQALFDGYVARGWSPTLPEAGRDELQRQVDTLTADRETLIRSVEGLTIRMDDLATKVGSVVLPSKTQGGLSRAVDKSEDVAGNGATDEAQATAPSPEELARALAALPPDERNLIITRAALANPIAISR